MSIVRQLIQICAVQAMRGRTQVGDLVYDSAITALDMIVADDPRPVIVVSVEETTISGKNEDGFFGRASEVKLVVQSVIASRQIFVDANQNQVEYIEFGDSDAAYEFTLNVIERQWRDALSDPANLWADRLKLLVPQILMIKDQRMTDPESGRKYSARMTEITGTAIAEPYFGSPLPEDLAAILEAIGEVPGYANLSQIWTKVFAAQGSMLDLTDLQATAFLSNAGASALGISLLEPEGDPMQTGIIAMNGGDDIEVSDV